MPHVIESRGSCIIARPSEVRKEAARPGAARPGIDDLYWNGVRWVYRAERALKFETRQHAQQYLASNSGDMWLHVQTHTDAIPWLTEAAIAKNRNTYAKRQREQDKKQRADKKREKRDRRREEAGKPPEWADQQDLTPDDQEQQVLAPEDPQ